MDILNAAMNVFGLYSNAKPTPWATAAEKNAVVDYFVKYIDRKTVGTISVNSVRGSALRLHDWYCAAPKQIFYMGARDHPYIKLSANMQHKFIKSDYIRLASWIIVHHSVEYSPQLLHELGEEFVNGAQPPGAEWMRSEYGFSSTDYGASVLFTHQARPDLSFHTYGQTLSVAVDKFVLADIATRQCAAMLFEVLGIRRLRTINPNLPVLEEQAKQMIERLSDDPPAKV